MRIQRILPGFIRRGLRSVFGACSEIYLAFIRDLDGEFGAKRRYAYYKTRLRSLGPNTVIDTGVYMRGLEYISIGANTHIDKGCLLIASSADIDFSKRAMLETRNPRIEVVRGSLVIGDHCHIAPFSQIHAYGGVVVGAHCALASGTKIFSMTSLPYNPFAMAEVCYAVPYDGVSPTQIGPIELGCNVMTGIHSSIFPGVKIGSNSFVRANSVVTNSFPDNSYIAGDPAEWKKKRFRI